MGIEAQPREQFLVFRNYGVSSKGAREAGE